MTVIQNLIENGNFERGELSPWKGKNVDVIASPCPVVVGDFSGRLKGGEVVASIFQNFNVVTGEVYQLTLSISTARKGTSPPLRIRVEYLNRILEVVGFGLEESISQSQLPNGADGKFTTVQFITTVVPEEARFARLIIEKQGLAFSPSVVIDNVLMIRIIAEQTPIPNTYVGNTGTDTTSIIFEDRFNTLTVGNTPNAMIRAFNGEKRLLYIAFGNEQYVSVIDVSAQEELTTIPVSGVTDFYYNRNIAVSPDGSKVFITTNAEAGFVNVIDTSTNQLAGVVTVGENPTAVEISSNGLNLYVASVGSTSVVQIDTESLVITETYTLNSNYSFTLFLALASNDQQVIIGSQGDPEKQGDDDPISARFSVVEVSSGETKTENIFGGSNLMFSMVISLDEEFVYFGNEIEDNEGCDIALFYVYDTSDYKEVTFLQLGVAVVDTSNPNVITQASEGDNEDFVFVSVVGLNISDIFEISRCGDTFTNVTNICIPGLTSSGFDRGYISISSDGTQIVTANEGENTISFVPTDTFNIRLTLEVGTGPAILVVD
ncbi:NTTRR-F1 domain [Bacillus carboniphilus]|uniref:NTTRR-F1 domain n=1 Tax=Bacillus carboniphilus TaxID=86663 RepID=A0ABY9JV30_9BACI|nr:NTTRR-F1 domain [Bacillus carboniphilus]WLR43256.1 NTTRR-F1 domain [Bacillus carboniphilus]